MADDFTDLEPAPRPPLTGWQALYRGIRGTLYILIPMAMILGAAISMGWLTAPKRDWTVLVQLGQDTDWKMVGEYADEAGCLSEARTRNETKAELRFACYSKHESPDDDEPIDKVLRRQGSR